MHQDLDREVAKLGQMTVSELRQRYAEIFGEPTRAGHKEWLRKRLAWRLQALAEGDITERARRRAAELARDADLRLSPPKQPASETTSSLDSLNTPARQRTHDPRIPAPGTVLVRQYRGRSFQVKVLTDGFEYQDRHFESLSAVALAITGGHCNGFLFFRLTPRKR
jgi:Protein of unknown function (DUF2924)